MSSSNSQNNMQPIRTKVFFPKSQDSFTTQIRRWKVETFEELKEKSTAVLKSLDSFRWEYLDDVNDWVVLEDQNEWKEAVLSLQGQSRPVLVLRLVPQQVRKHFPHHHHHRRHHCHAANQMKHCPMFSAAEKMRPFVVRLSQKVPSQENTSAQQAKQTNPRRESGVSSFIDMLVDGFNSLEKKLASAAADSPKKNPNSECSTSSKRSVPIEGENNSEDIEVSVGQIDRKNIPIAGEDNQSEEIPVHISPKRVVRNIPIEGGDDEETVNQEESKQEQPLENKEEEHSSVQDESESSPQIELEESTIKNYTIEDEEEEEQKEEEIISEPEEKPFSNEEKILQSMGFTDSKLNFHLLKHNKGNMERTINSLLKLDQ